MSLINRKYASSNTVTKLNFTVLLLVINFWKISTGCSKSRTHICAILPQMFKTNEMNITQIFVHFEPRGNNDWVGTFMQLLTIVN